MIARDYDGDLYDPVREIATGGGCFVVSANGEPKSETGDRAGRPG